MAVTLQGSALPVADAQAERIFVTLAELQAALAGGPWTDAAHDRLLAAWQSPMRIAHRGVAFDPATREQLRASYVGLAAQTRAAAREYWAHRTRYERQLHIPPASARTHQRGKPWRQHEMCARQWRQLQVIRERDRERRARKREHDRAVERELRTMLTTPARPQREKVAR